MMQLLASKNVPSLVPVFFGVRKQKNNLQASLMTEELAGYQSLEDATEALFASKKLSLTAQRDLVRQVAFTVAKLHRAGVQHRSLYPKHLFVDKQNTRNVVVIDLEKSRTKWLPAMRTFYDLSTLNRHAKYWSKTTRLYFYKQYFGVKTLNAYQKWLLKLIVKRSTRQKNHSTAKKIYQGQK
jgi:tRNA A-37 threonylcarbamoyl transferase component Bud32